MAGYEEDEHVLSAIFKNSLQDSWKDNADFTHYVAELMGFGLDALVHEPDRLAEERAHVKQQTEDLAYNNYKTFIKTAECSREIFQDFQIIESHLSDVIDLLPKFSAACNGFAKVAQDIGHSRKTNMVTLQRHTQLLEVLEIPQLMDTCVRNGYYEEALELAAYTRRLEKKHAAIAIVKSICADVKSCTQLMLTQLLQQLRSDIQLPSCLRIIGYLRRMDVFSEAELRIKFLQARDSWFQSMLDAIPTADGYTHITKVIEASRVHLFDIVTQYRAIFSDDDPLVAVSSIKDEGLSESAIFPCWILRKVNSFLQMLQADLERGGSVEGRLDSIAGQCMYFGLSFSRVGCDFRGLLVPILSGAASRAFQHSVLAAAASFDEAMQSFVLLSLPTAVPALYQSHASGSEASPTLNPPIKLIEFTPLAVYCNGVLTAFNNLRLCAPLSVAADVAKALEESCKRVTDSLLRFHRSEQALFHGREGAKFADLCTCFALDLLPFFNNCLEALFPPQSLCSVLGLSPSEYRSLRTGMSIDVDFVVAPLKGFLPALVPAQPALPEAVVQSPLSTTESVLPAGQSPLPTAESVLHAANYRQPDTSALKADRHETILSAVPQSQPAIAAVPVPTPTQLPDSIRPTVAGSTAVEPLLVESGTGVGGGSGSLGSTGVDYASHTAVPVAGDALQPPGAAAVSTETMAAGQLTTGTFESSALSATPHTLAAVVEESSASELVQLVDENTTPLGDQHELLPQPVESAREGQVPDHEAQSGSSDWNQNW